jgi:hypothetical protein
LKKLFILLILFTSVLVQAQDVAIYSRSFTDTVGTASDSLSRKVVSSLSNTLEDAKIKSWQAHIYTDDTLKVSTDPTFPADNTNIIYPFQLTPLVRCLTKFFPNLYIQRYGTEGTPVYSFGFWGF